MINDDDIALELVAVREHPAHKVPTWFYRIVIAESREPVGNINLRLSIDDHVRLYAGQVGYDVEPQHRGRRYAARAVRSLIPFARELGLSHLWITCDPENWTSRRSCEAAGATLVEVVDVPKHCVIYQKGHPRKCRFLLRF